MPQPDPGPCRGWLRVAVACLVAGCVARGPAPAGLPVGVPVDLSGFSADSGVKVERRDGRLRVSWPTAPGETGRVDLRLDGSGPLIERLGVASGDGDAVREATLLRDVDPVFFLTVGERRTPRGKPPEQSWRVFFDWPVERPHETFASRLELRRVTVRSEGRRATVSLDHLAIGPFSGTMELTFYPGCRLVHAEAVVRTEVDRRAVIYDAGLLGGDAGWRRLAWIDTEGRTVRKPADVAAGDRALAVRHRALVAECDGGAVACFPPPHQFQFPRDWTDNVRFVWYGRGHRGRDDRFGFGIRQHERGRNRFIPWFNAPPEVSHRLGVFLLLTFGDADDALRETLRFTNGDRFPELSGHLTMTSHLHMAVAVTAMKQKARGVTPLPTPDFVGMFKDMNVNMVHLAEFHGDGHQKDPGPRRLPELEAMFSECRRLSDDRLLLIPGEEVNTFLGIREPGKHPGHWMSLFPKPVRWIMQREDGQPFVEEHPEHGRVYRVGSRGDMVRLLREEGGLVWAAHPRIKASSWTPDIFRREDFYLADFWLGGAWKAMPGDLSHAKLGEETLDLLSDMANWGQEKYLLGEVDVFQLDHTHELYGHMNINYVRLDTLPRFDDGWQPVLDALRGGRFFVTTGEVLIRDFRVGGRRSGEKLARGAAKGAELVAELEWTFPLRFAEIVSGDGERVFRKRIDLADTGAFGTRTLRLRPDLAGRRWVRFEVWDVAVNGAFTQPVWIPSE